MGSLSKILAILLIALFLMSLITLQQIAVKAQPNNQAPAIEFQREYGESRTESVSNLIQTSDGGYAFVDLGWAHSITFQPSTFYKINSSGNLQQARTIDNFAASYIIQTSDGGYEISGHWSTYPNDVEYSPTLIKTDSDGNTQWVQNYTSEPDLGTAPTRIQTSDNGFAYIAQGSIVKTDSIGNLQWIINVTFQGLNPAKPDPLPLSYLIETSDGALAAIGVGNPDGGVWGNIYLVKTAAFLPLPSQTPLPTPIATPKITVSKPVLTPIIIAITFIVVVILGISVALLIYRRHQKTLSV